MTNDQHQNIGDREVKILELVDNGYTDFQRIREQLTLSWRQLDYSLEKLEDADLITTRQQDGYITREVDGQRRKFKAPRVVELTDAGEEYLARREVTERYASMSRDELIEKIFELEQRIDNLESGFETFRQQVRQKLD